MRGHLHRRSESLARHQALLVAMSNDLTLPLIQIKSGLELMDETGYAKAMARQQARAMNLSVEAGFQLIETYRLLLKSEELALLDFEPVAVGAVLEEVAHHLSTFAREYSTKIEIDVQGKLAPVLVHQPSLTAVIQSLSYSLIRAQAAQSEGTEYRLILGAHRSAGSSVTTGVFSNVQGLSDRSLKAAHSLAGQARQPLPAVPPGAASGVLVADMLCAHMWQPLRTAAHNHFHGLVTALPTTNQLQFV